MGGVAAAQRGEEVKEKELRLVLACRGITKLAPALLANVSTHSFCRAPSSCRLR
jgi:hypothetical protein